MPFLLNLKLSSANSLSLEESKLHCLGKSYHFLLFPQCFLHRQSTKIIILATVNLSSANAYNLDQSRTLSFGKELSPDF